MKGDHLLTRFVEIGGPIVHQPSPLEQVRSRVGRFDLVANEVGQRHLDHLAPVLRVLRRQCRNDDRKQPCGPVWIFNLLRSPRRVVTELTVDDREHRRIVAAAEPGKTPMDGYGRQSPW